MDLRIGTRKYQRFVTRIGPAHDVRRSTVVAVHLDDLAVPIRLTYVGGLDDQSVSRGCSHLVPPCVRAIVSVAAPPWQGPKSPVGMDLGHP